MGVLTALVGELYFLHVYIFLKLLQAEMWLLVQLVCHQLQ